MFDAQSSGENHEDVIILYKEALRQYPDDKRLYINLGALESKTAMQMRQLKFYSGPIKLEQESPVTLNNLGTLRDLNGMGKQRACT